MAAADGVIGGVFEGLQDHEKRIAGLEAAADDRFSLRTVSVIVTTVAVAAAIIYLVAYKKRTQGNARTSEVVEESARRHGRERFGVGIGEPPKHPYLHDIEEWFGRNEDYLEWLNQPVADRKVQEQVWQRQRDFQKLPRTLCECVSLAFLLGVPGVIVAGWIVVTSGQHNDSK